MSLFPLQDLNLITISCWNDQKNEQSGRFLLASVPDGHTRSDNEIITSLECIFSVHLAVSWWGSAWCWYTALWAVIELHWWEHQLLSMVPAYFFKQAPQIILESAVLWWPAKIKVWTRHTVHLKRPTAASESFQAPLLLAHIDVHHCSVFLAVQYISGPKPVLLGYSIVM